MLNGKTEFAEVQFYFQIQIDQEKPQVLALVSLYGPRNEHLFSSSYQTIWLAQYLGIGNLRVINVSTIQSVVAMVPLNPLQPSSFYFVVEKPGLEMLFLSGIEEEMTDE